MAECKCGRPECPGYVLEEGPVVYESSDIGRTIPVDTISSGPITFDHIDEPLWAMNFNDDRNNVYVFDKTTFDMLLEAITSGARHFNGLDN